MKSMRFPIIALGASLAILAVSVAPSAAEEATASENKAKAGEGPSAVLDNTPGAVPEDVESRDAGTRGTACHLIVDNRTDWIIKVYVNNGYVGTLPRSGELGSWWRKNRSYEVYGRADFTDGTWRYWGPQRIYCQDKYTLSWSR